MHRILFVMFGIIFLFSQPLQAQSTLPLITTDSAAQIVEIVSVQQAGLTDITWSPDNRILAVASTAGVWLYDAYFLNLAPRLLGGQASPVAEIAFSPDGSLLAAASGSVIRVWDVMQDRELQSIHGNNPIAFSPDGTHIAYSAGGLVMRSRNLTTGMDDATFEGHTDRITDVAFSTDGGVVVTTSLDMTLRLWNAVSGAQLGFQRSRRRPLLTTSINPNGALIASGTRRGMVRILNAAVDTEHAYGLGQSNDINSIAFSPINRTTLLAFSVGNTVQLWDLDTSSDPLVLTGHTDVVLDVAFNPDGTRLASIGQDGFIRLWGVQN